jgi:hypothetical protein
MCADTRGMDTVTLESVRVTWRAYAHQNTHVLSSPNVCAHKSVIAYNSLRETDQR